MSEDSVKKRFLFKLIISVLSAGMNFGIMLFLPKALGPMQYGQYEFAINNFSILISALTFSVPDAYFNWISRKAKTLNIGEVTASTFSFLVLIFFSVLLFMVSVQAIGVFDQIWPGIGFKVAVLGLLIAFGTQIFNTCSILADGLGFTATFELFRLGQNVLKFIFLGALCFIGYATIDSALSLFFITIFLTSSSAMLWFLKKKVLKLNDFHIHKWNLQDLRVYSVFTYDYVKPLIIYSGVGFAFSFFDIWFLQYIGGSIEQGYLGISLRLAGLAGLINMAIHPILSREIAMAYEGSNIDRMTLLFKRIRFFYFTAVFIGTILYFNAETVLSLIGGKDFEGAIIVFKLLAFYPALQTLGRLYGAVYYSTGRTKLYSNVGIVVMPIGIILAYILIGRLGMGALGVAYKMMIIDAISITSLLFFNARFLGISFAKEFIFLIIITVFQTATYYGLEFIITSTPLIEMVIQTSVFLALCGFVTLLLPSLIGVSRKDLYSHLRIGRGKN